MITGNGYEGVVYLPVTLTPPSDLKPGETVTLSAEAKWLMCAEVCVPGKASVALTLPVRADPPPPDTVHGQAIADALAQLPRPIPEISVRATRNGPTIRLHLSGGDNPPSQFEKPWFFSSDATIQFDEPQAVHAAGSDHSLVIDLPVSSHLAAPPSRLTGVLRIENVPSGIAIDTPIETTAAPADSGLSTLNSPPSTPSLGITRATPETTVAVDTLAGTLALAFIGGLILNLMPCVFPVLGIKILGFVNQAGSDRRKVTLHGLAFAGGVLLTFWILGGLLVTFWQGTGWGTQLQNPKVNLVVAALFLLFALSMSGVFEIGQSATRLGNVTAARTGYFFTLLEGVFITLVATPCSAPLLGTAIGAALTTLEPPQAMLVFTSIALGLAAPYLLLSLFPQGVKLLPKPGAWMETLKQFLAFPIYAAVGFFVWVLVPQVSDEHHLNIIGGLVVIALGAWLYGRYATYGAKPARARFGIIGGLSLLILGTWLGWPQTPGAPTPTTPPAVVWQPWSAEAVAKAVTDGKPVYVDFTARWCFTCQTNKKVVFSSSEVLQTFRDKNVITLRADWTNEDPLITTELAKWNRSAVPFNLIYLPGKPDPVILPELLTPGIVLNVLSQTP
jgi:thiol:disulfide interchange protein DsbD